MTTQCKDCPDRRATCHAECEKYQAFRAEREAAYEERRKQWYAAPPIPEMKKQHARKRAHDQLRGRRVN